MMAATPAHTVDAAQSVHFIKTPPGVVDYALLALLSAIFGAAFMLNGIAVKSIPPLTIVCVRLGLAAAIVYLAARVAGKAMPSFAGGGRIWAMICASSILGNALPFFLITWGQESVDAGLAAILTSTSPLMTLALVHWLTRDEKIDRYKLIGVVLGLGGIIHLFGVDKLFSFSSDSIRQYAILAAALCYALNVIIMKQLTGLPRYGTVAAVLFISFMIMVPFSLVVDHPLALMLSGTITAGSAISVLLLGIFSSAAGNLLRFKIVERQGAAFLSQINYLVPVFALLWAFLLLSEVPTHDAYIALGLIFAGIAVARLGNRRIRALPVGVAGKSDQTSLSNSTNQIRQKVSGKTR
jgi:drug/metabolite transporter (DMT)-like permease